MTACAGGADETATSRKIDKDIPGLRNTVDVGRDRERGHLTGAPVTDRGWQRPYDEYAEKECSMPMSSHLTAVRAKVGHDLLTMAAAAISVFDSSGRLLLGEDAETGLWTLPGGAIDPNEHPADAATRECFEETGLLVKPERLVGVFGGPEFLIHYPNGDLTYYTTVAFEASLVGGSLKADGEEIARLRYFSQVECDALALTPSSRIISRQSFKREHLSYFAPARWHPGKD